MHIADPFIARAAPLVEETLTQLTASAFPLLKPIRHGLLGGKRLRPLLTLAVVDTYDAPLERALIPAAALELIHTYSLIHDDLPCMDNDDLRRGKPTLHKAFSESTAVLTGDALLTYAFEVLANAPHLTDSEKVALTSILATRSGMAGMIGGQVLDIAHMGKFESLASLTETHQKKTGALITAALEFGAILADQPLEPLQNLGAHLGLAYQVVDDLLDGDGAAELLGIEEAREWAHALHDQAIKAIEPAPLLEELVSHLIFKRLNSE